MLLEVDIEKKLKEFTLRAAFTLPDGSGLLGLMGASGSGKSMTLKCLAGLETPDCGRIVLNGRVLFDSAAKLNLPPQRRRVGYLFQSYALFPNMSVSGNIECGLRAQGLGKDARRQRIAELIDSFHLQGLEQRYPRQLSGGQKQRVALARLLGAEPELLLLDEPFSALDEELKQELQGQLQQLLASFGKPAILVSHDRREVERLCGRVLYIKQGALSAVKF